MLRSLLVLWLPWLLATKSIIMRIVFRSQETTLRIGHGAHVVIDKLGELLRWPQRLFIALVAPIAICPRRRIAR